MADETWDIEVGSTTTRRAVSGKYGGSPYGGIEPSARTPNLFIYSDPVEGHKRGYIFDGWSEDEGTFFYTGEGPSGDQKLTAGNASIASHADDGRTLRVFVADGKVAGSQTKRQLYIGEFRLDPTVPYVRPEAAGDDGALRTVLVFRLRPVGHALRRPEDRSEQADLGAPETVSIVPFDAARAVAGAADAVAIEQHSSAVYRTSGSTGLLATRRENELVERLMAARGGRSRFSRYRVTPDGALSALYTDAYDSVNHVLYEAKGTATREAVRMALGQLLDYSRWVPGLPRLAVLLPARPANDLVSLLAKYGIGCTFETKPGVFVDHEHPPV